jgi:hypothetical protein
MLWLVDSGMVQDRTPGKYMANASDRDCMRDHVASADCRRAMRKLGKCSSI